MVSGDAVKQGIDDGVAGDVYVLSGDSILQQIRFRRRGWRKMHRGQLAGEAPIHFLRKGISSISGSQSRLEMDYRNGMIKSGQSRSKTGRRVTLNQNGGRPFGLDYR